MTETVLVPLPFFGLAGAAFGTALSLTIARRAWLPHVRVLALFLLTYSLVAGFISARHGRIVAPGVWGDHLVNLAGLTLYPVFVWYAAAKRPRVPFWMLAVPAGSYVVWVTTAIAAGVGTAVPFRLLLPVIIGFTALATFERIRARATWREQESVSPSVIPIDALLAFSFALNAAQTVRTIWNRDPYVREIVPIVMTIGFAGLALVVARRAGGAVTRSTASSTRKYERSAIRAGDAEPVLQRLDAALRDDRAFLDPELTLTTLAARVGIPPQTLSQLLTQHRATTFYAYINALRVAEAKRLLRDPSRAHHTIEAIAHDAGFSSRSTFYKAFRALEGLSPVEFRDRNRQPLR